MSRQWCILRTSGPKTLPLAASLAAAGYDVWTPTSITLQRVRGKRKRLEREVPIAPTFVFARAGHLTDMVRASAALDSQHPSFSIFQLGGRIPIIADEEVTGFREAEEAAARATAARRRAEIEIAKRGEKDALRQVIPVGQEITPSEGPFAGMTGVVMSSDRKTAWVDFGGAYPLKIDTWLLASDIVGSTLPITGMAA